MGKTLLIGLAAFALAASCKKKSEQSTAAGSGSAPTMAGSAAPAKAMTADDLVKRFHECWGFWAGAKWDDFKGCYADNAVDEAPGGGMPQLTSPAAIVEEMKRYRAASPDESAQTQLVLVNGKKLAAVTLLGGKLTGALEMSNVELPATDKPFGFLMGQVLAVDDAGKVTHEWDFFDAATMIGQLRPMKDHPVRAATDKLAMPEQDVIAKDDADERANLATYDKLVDAFDKHDVKAFGELIADDTVWSEQPDPKDMTRKQLLANMAAMWKGFPDAKLGIGEAWSAGPYVVATETFEGTNEGDLPMMHVKKTGKKVSIPVLAIHQFDKGKVKATWMFFQSMGFATQLGLVAEQGAEAKETATVAKDGSKKKPGAKHK